jgi:hypothetical protein
MAHVDVFARLEAIGKSGVDARAEAQQPGDWDGGEGDVVLGHVWKEGCHVQHIGWLPDILLVGKECRGGRMFKSWYITYQIALVLLHYPSESEVKCK